MSSVSSGGDIVAEPPAARDRDSYAGGKSIMSFPFLGVYEGGSRNPVAGNALDSVEI